MNEFCKYASYESASGMWTRRKICKDKIGVLCYKCNDAYKKEQFCFYCKQIYIDVGTETTLADGLEWIECDTCHRWLHTHCEIEHGYVHLKELTASGEEFDYSCI